MRNEDIGKKTDLRKLQHIIKERGLRWVGHVLRMEDSRTPDQATQWELSGYKKSWDSQVQTGWTLSTEISRTWTLPGKKLKN